MNVLIVDDNDDIRRLVTYILELGGHASKAVASGVEALAHLRATPAADMPDLVLLDIQMPELDGWDTLRQIRADPATARLRVMMCTVKATRDDFERAAVLGCDGYLTKPFAIEDLLRTVDRVAVRD